MCLVQDPKLLLLDEPTAGMARADTNNTIEARLKRLIVDALMLEDVTPEEIVDEEPLFGEGLGLDSIDALELGLAIHKEFGVRTQ